MWQCISNNLCYSNSTENLLQAKHTFLDQLLGITIDIASPSFRGVALPVFITTSYLVQRSFFRGKATVWWNSLPADLTESRSNVFVNYYLFDFFDCWLNTVNFVELSSCNNYVCYCLF